MALPPSFHNAGMMRMNVRCPVCGSLYDLSRLQILGERDQQILAYIDCANCSTSLVSILSVSPAGMTAQGMVTDLTPDELTASLDRTAISQDDVLTVHESLEGNHSNFFTQPHNTL